jgi:hypothetical protein
MKIMKFRRLFATQTNDEIPQAAVPGKLHNYSSSLLTASQQNYDSKDPRDGDLFF